MDASLSHELSNLRKFVAPEILFGAGARKAVANDARTFGARKVLLVSAMDTLAGTRVLVVDNDESVLLSMCALLQAT